MSKKIFNERCLRVIGEFTGDIRASFHGRELARKMRSNQRTVQLCLNRLEKEKILRSKTKGRLKEFSLNLESPLTMQILTAAEIYRAYRLFSSNFEILQIISDVLKITGGAVIIYGSFAKGYAAKESDLDILVIGKSSREKENSLQAKYSRKIHFMSLKEKEFTAGLEKKSSFAKEVAESHIICQGSEAFVKWRLKHG